MRADLKLEVNHIDCPTIKFLIIIVFALILTAEFTSNTPEFTKYRVYPVFAALHEENKEYVIDSLFVALLTNGDASIDYNLAVNTNKSNTKLRLFGETVQNLTLTDYNETNIRYKSTGLPNEITVFSQNSPDIHVTYMTSDLVDKQNRNWTFSFSFPDKFLLKMPSQAHITHMDPPAFLTPTDDQNLWGFGPGDVRVSYVIGPLGTREEARASIRSVEEGIKETRSNYQGIILDNTTSLLENARLSFKQGKYFETVTYATNALTLLQNTGQNFVTANAAISQAEKDIQNNRNNGYDTAKAEVTLSTARNLSSVGKYEYAENAAKQAANQVEQKSDTPSITNSNIVIAALGIVVAIILITFAAMRKRKNSSTRTIISEPSSAKDHDSMDGTNNEKISSVSNSSNIPKTNVSNLSPIQFNAPVDSVHDSVEIKNYLEKVVEEVGNVRKNNDAQHEISRSTLSPLDGHAINKQSLFEVVSQMKKQNPHLRNDDKELLDFLCEKEGSSFESEIRNKFILPRTSLWRLIKRLEREDLVVVRKIGGQNLIKLKFEDSRT